MNFKELLLYYMTKNNQQGRSIRYLLDVDHTKADRVRVTVILTEDSSILDEHSVISFDKSVDPTELENTACEELITKYVKIPKRSCLRRK